MPPTVWVLIHDEGGWDSYPQLLGVFSTRANAEERARAKDPGDPTLALQHQPRSDEWSLGCCRVEEVEVDA